MFRIIQRIRRNADLVYKLLPIFAFIAPALILYCLYPSSFEMMWKGRTFYLFFLWLSFLEIVLEWENIPKGGVGKPKSIKTVALATAILLPTIYVIVANFAGVNRAIVDLATASNIEPDLRGLMPLSTEYLVFTALFALLVLLLYGKGGVRIHALSMLFLGIIGVIYTIDNFYPYGRFTPFQLFVPITTVLAANTLNLMGYATIVQEIRHPNYGWLQSLTSIDPNNLSRRATFQIAWPCAGVESLLIYTVTVLLFLKNTPIPWKHRIAYFAFGAIITFFINILRVVTIFLLGMDAGGNVSAPEVQQFHNFYGQLYSITWIILYPLIIIGSRMLWGKINTLKTGRIEGFEPMPRTPLQ